MRACSKEDLAYAAGLIDGEGTITLSYKYASSPFRHPAISVASTTFELVAFLQKTLGGVITNKKTYAEHHKLSYTWTAKNSTAITIIEQVAPYLKEPEKSRRAFLLIQDYPKITKRNGKYTLEELNAKYAFEETFFKNSLKSPQTRLVEVAVSKPRPRNL